MIPPDRWCRICGYESRWHICNQCQEGEGSAEDPTPNKEPRRSTNKEDHSG